MTALDDVRRLDRQYFDDHPDLCTFCRPMFAAEYQALCRIHEVPQHCSIRDGLVHVTKSTQTTRTFSWRHHPASKRPA
jgi:hypothetical protein